MAQPVTAAHVRRIELPLREVRSRLSQLVRMAGVTGQVTVVVDEGRPIAEIRPVSPAAPDRPPGRDLRPLPRSRPPSPGTPPAERHAAPQQEATAPGMPGSHPPARSATSASASPGAPIARGASRPGGSASQGASLPGGLASQGASAAPGASAAGWMRRLDKVREDLKRQHAVREDELVRALDEAWRLLDETRPPGTDRQADVLRAAHRSLRDRPPA